MTRITNVQLTLPTGALSDADLSANASISTSKMAQRVLAGYPVPFTSYRVWDAVTTVPVTSAANDDLALVGGTFGTDFPTLETGDLKAAGSTSRKIGFAFQVPPNYDATETIQCRIRAGMETTVADTAATVDLEVYASDLDGAVGSDLCTTSAQSANSLTLANLDFTIDGSGLTGGEALQCVVTFLVNDGATGTAVTGVIPDIRMLIDTRG